ncbi:MAG: hypothetical protein M8357_06050 [Desulfobulbaceae bacterium]|nr:hypothetical protein [Desulfobulbaceae bacterium]
MLSSVHGKQRLHAGGQRDITIGGFDDPEFIAIQYESCPAAAELGNCRAGKFLLAGVHATERFLHFLFLDNGRFASTPSFRAFPVKSVVPDLRCIVEYRTFLRMSFFFGRVR